VDECARNAVVPFVIWRECPLALTGEGVGGAVSVVGLGRIALIETVVSVRGVSYSVLVEQDEFAIADAGALDSRENARDSDEQTADDEAEDGTQPEKLGAHISPISPESVTGGKFLGFPPVIILLPLVQEVVSYPLDLCSGAERMFLQAGEPWVLVKSTGEHPR
jgi:hypothetical protein